MTLDLEEWKEVIQIEEENDGTLYFVAPQMPPGAYRLKIRYLDRDQNGHLNHLSWETNLPIEYEELP